MFRSLDHFDFPCSFFPIMVMKGTDSECFYSAVPTINPLFIETMCVVQGGSGRQFSQLTRIFILTIPEVGK